jgi:glycerol dehydrogenase
MSKEKRVIKFRFYIKSFGESALVIGDSGDIERVQDKLDKTAGQ